MKLKSFGDIYEEKGNITFRYFHIDIENENVSCAEALLMLVIERLQKELDEVRKDK